MYKFHEPLTSPKDLFTDLLHWFKTHFTRKFTVLFHILGGLLLALYNYYCPGAFPAVLFVAFGVFEFWSARKGDEGFLDFWDMLFGAILGVGIALLIEVT